MLIKDVLGICEAKLIHGKEDAIIGKVSKDTRTIKKGETYLALKGEQFDGNNFYLDAIVKGASTCILSKIPPMETIVEYDCNIIVVDDTKKFVIELAKKVRNSINIPIIAITGSVGKTSTKNIVADTLACKYKVLKTQGNLNTDIGLALTLLSLTDEEIIVIEMGMNHFGEISCLTNIAKPTLAIITNIGTSHIGNLGSRENILKAKLEILEGLSGPIIINNDNDLLHNWYIQNKNKREIITYGIDEDSDFKATNLSYSHRGSEFYLNNTKVNINVIGKHFIYNSLVALIMGKLFDIDEKDICQKLQFIPLEPNRMELITTNELTIINDSYNASYDSVYYALEVLGTFKERKVAVLGDILELGNYAEEIMLKIGKLVVKNKINILITIGENSIYINEEALNNGFDEQNSYHFNNNEEAINHFNKLLKQNDIVLVKASNSMNFKQLVDYLGEEK